MTRLLFLVLFCACVTSSAGVARAADRLTVAEADRLVLSSDRGRDSELKRWARDATLAEIMFVLRHDPEQLGSAEAALVEEALERTSDSRPELRRHLRLRLAIADPGKAKKMLGASAADAADLDHRTRASAYRLAVLLPSEGAYASFSEALLLGIRAALSHHNANTSLPIELNVYASGDDAPARAAAVLDSASRRSAVVLGELLSVPTLSLATGARMMGWPLISPTATDENIGAAGPTVFQVGPSGYHRGVTLAKKVTTTARLRLAVLMSSDRAGTAFPTGFVNEYRRLGGEVVWQDQYAPGSLDFRSQVKRMQIENVQLLLWDGDTREAAVILREIEQAGLDITMCGAETLAPENFHRTSQPLLDGVQYVSDDWVLERNLGARLDSLVRASGEDKPTSLHLRGFLAAHLVAVIVEGRALCAEEIANSMATRVTGDAYLRSRGFLDWTVEGASLPVYEIRSGNPRLLP